MRLEDCIEKINGLSEWDIRFHILAEGSNGRKWPISFAANAAKMLATWAADCTGYSPIPENGDLIHGLLFVNTIDGRAMIADEADFEGFDFESLMGAFRGKSVS